MYKNYLIDYVIRNKNNHPLSGCKINSIIINTTNNNLIQNQKQIFNILNDLITIFGQFPKLKKAKKNVSAFNIRMGSTIGTTIFLQKMNQIKFIKKFIFSILPNLKIWQALKTQKKNKDFFIFNIGFKDLSFWYELKSLNNTGLHIQFIIKQLAKQKDFLFFLSKLNMKLKL